MLDTIHGVHVRLGTSIHLYHPRGVAESPRANGKNRQRWATRYNIARRGGESGMRALLEQITNEHKSSSQT